MKIVAFIPIKLNNQRLPGKNLMLLGDRPLCNYLFDTLVQVNDEVLGKPENQAEAKEMLKKLSGKWHQVFTGVCLICGEHAQTQVDKTDVLFSELTQELIDGYVATGEPMDKAGSYAVQGRGGMFVEALNGSYSNVIGLPLALVRKMLETAGINLFKNETDV